MKLLIFVAVIAILHLSLAVADNMSKVKLTECKVLKKSPEYYGTKPFITEVVKVNETYNRLAADYWVIKDYPLDTKYTAEVFRSQLVTSGKYQTCGEYQKLSEYTVSICSHNKDQYDVYMPEAYQALKKAGKCLTKRHAQTNDDGLFKFYNAVTSEKLTNACFKVINYFFSANEDIFVSELTYVTNDY